MHKILNLLIYFRMAVSETNMAVKSIIEEVRELQNVTALRVG